MRLLIQSPGGVFVISYSHDHILLFPMGCLPQSASAMDSEDSRVVL